MVLIHAESRWVEAHYEIAAHDAHLLAAALGVSVDRIVEGWRVRGPRDGSSSALVWLEDHGIPYRTAFVWMTMDD